MHSKTSLSMVKHTQAFHCKLWNAIVNPGVPQFVNCGQPEYEVMLQPYSDRQTDKNGLKPFLASKLAK